MKDFFYGSDHDLVKWTALLQLASQYGIASILQVPYRTPPKVWPSVEIDGMECPVPAVVMSHFRELHRIAQLSQPGVAIRLVDPPRDGGYLPMILRAMEDVSGSGPCIVFLDPERGLGQQHGQAPKSELLPVWNKLHPDDILVFSQRSYGHKKWIENKRAMIEDALGIRRGATRLARGSMHKSRRFCPDVVLFFVQKTVL